jgi:L-cysteine:1D-myo-inositol 2-amino-2-deoxy-alpha-D-glucopyranoside ligase
MKFYETQSREMVSFAPKQDTVTIYVCGVTPYDSAHLGHIFTFMTYDLLQRRLEDLGYKVKLVRNITDVDEPIFARAAEQGEHYKELAKREIDSFQDIMRKLNFRDPTAEPLASEYIEDMARAVQKLLGTGHAYRLEQDIYFDVSTHASFGSFSNLPDRLQIEFMRDRGGDPERHGKRHPLDFLLWRGISDKSDPAAWDTTVGYGRPGWHIECSIMSSHLLGTPIDIHGGGMDLIFPHHECEITQNESLGQKPFARNWLHVAPLSLYGEKMSKSLGNLVFADDLIKEHSPAAVRILLLNYHHGIGGEWRDDLWQGAKSLSDDLQQYVKVQSSTTKTGLLNEVRAALDDNLDTPSILKAFRQHMRDKGDISELVQSLELLGIRF